MTRSNSKIADGKTTAKKIPVIIDSNLNSSLVRIFESFTQNTQEKIGKMQGKQSNIKIGRKITPQFQLILLSSLRDKNIKNMKGNTTNKIIIKFLIKVRRSYSIINALTVFTIAHTNKIDR
ncbi:hypothetical protein M0813_13309 [Anaeramoeba flamelloides]|uniref:Ribosomal protein S7 n=1 Tax=Anaeramoeba flamelloides TaxID=1746091 RepID=A0ABQ8ZAI6_9EUKA|nr:hypothetical protein M0813_13309 [Anaeramoeba flamelloides]